MLCFWALFAFGVIATFWQQFRSAQADLAKGTGDVWMDIVAKMFYPPPAVPLSALEKTRIRAKTAQADLTAEFAGTGDLLVRFVDKSPVPAEQPKHWSALIDATNMIVWPGNKPDDYNLLPLATQSWDKDYIRRDNPTGAFSVLGEQQTKWAKDHVKKGDIVTGLMCVTCLNCVKTRGYYIYFQFGVGGWYYPTDKPLPTPFKRQKQIPMADLQAFINRNIPLKGRVTMPPRFY